MERRFGGRVIRVIEMFELPLAAGQLRPVAKVHSVAVSFQRSRLTDRLAHDRIPSAVYKQHCQVVVHDDPVVMELIRHVESSHRGLAVRIIVHYQDTIGAHKHQKTPKFLVQDGHNPTRTKMGTVMVG